MGFVGLDGGIGEDWAGSVVQREVTTKILEVMNTAT